MMDMWLAVLFICSLQGDCKMFADKTGPSGSVVACRVRLDKMTERIRKDGSGVTKAIGRFDKAQNFRGLCINPDPSVDLAAEIERYII